MQTLNFKTIAKKTFLFITGVWFIASFAQGQQQAVSRNTKDEKAVLQTERELLQAWIQGDTNTLNRMLASNYISYNSLTKQDVIKNAKPLSDMSFDSSQLKARLSGDSAEVTGVLLLKWRGGTDVYLQVVDQLVKYPAGWRSVSTHRETMPICESKFYKDTEMSLLTALSCNEQSRLKSLNADQSAMLKFTNSSTQTVIIRWLNYNGELDTHPYLINTILPGTSIVIMTFVTHPFVVTDKTGKCLGIFKPNPEPSLAIIK